MSNPPRYRVTLTQAERDDLEALGRSGRVDSKKLLAARMLLLCNRGPHDPGWLVAEDRGEQSPRMSLGSRGIRRRSQEQASMQRKNNEVLT